MSAQKWRLELERIAEDFCSFLNSRGITSSKGKTGDYYVEIHSSVVFKIYSNRRGDRRMVFSPLTHENERAELLSFWEEFKGNVHLGTEIYVDGSFRDDHFGYSAVVVENGSIVKKLSGCSRELHGLRNVSGEIRAVEVALEYCKENEIEKVKIYYDYEGLRSWPLRLWKAKNSLTAGYRDFVVALSAEVTIEWVKIDSHTGDSYNEMADKLAKAALRKCLD